jgi:hypothetical protein
MDTKIDQLLKKNRFDKNDKIADVYEKPVDIGDFGQIR